MKRKRTRRQRRDKDGREDEERNTDRNLSKDTRKELEHRKETKRKEKKEKTYLEERIDRIREEIGISSRPVRMVTEDGRILAAPENKSINEREINKQIVELIKLRKNMKQSGKEKEVDDDGKIEEG